MLFVCVRVRPSNQNSKCKAQEVRKSLVGQPLGEGETLPVVGVVGTFLRCRCQGCALSVFDVHRQILRIQSVRKC